MPKGIYERNKTKPIKRFLQKIKVTENGCWEWQASKMQSGYGEFWNGVKKVLAHRWSYEHYIGKIPDGKQIDHLCRNRACVNPDHLEPVTNAENGKRGDTGNHRRKEAEKITHCPHGHEYTKENTYWRKSKYGKARECKTCKRIRRRKHYERNRA